MAGLALDFLIEQGNAGIDFMADPVGETAPSGNDLDFVGMGGMFLKFQQVTGQGQLPVGGRRFGMTIQTGLRRRYFDQGLGLFVVQPGGNQVPFGQIFERIAVAMAGTAMPGI